MSLGTRRIALALAGAIAVVLVAFAAPAFALTEEQCIDKLAEKGPYTEYTCTGSGGVWELTGGGSDFGSEGGGIPGGFVAVIVLVVILGIGTTIWKVTTARQLARDAGMDPDIAAGMTLLDNNGLSAAYIASSVRTNRPDESSAPPKPKPLPSTASATDRLTELKSLLDGGLITLVEYDERRKAIVDSL